MDGVLGVLFNTLNGVLAGVLAGVLGVWLNNLNGVIAGVFGVFWLDSLKGVFFILVDGVTNWEK